MRICEGRYLSKSRRSEVVVIAVEVGLSLSIAFEHVGLVPVSKWLVTIEAEASELSLSSRNVSEVVPVGRIGQERRLRPEPRYLVLCGEGEIALSSLSG